MGLLHPNERQKLQQLLLQLPGIALPATRTFLLTGIPDWLQHLIPGPDVPFLMVSSIISTLEGPGAQLANGTWPICWVIDNAINMVPGSEVGSQLEQLRAAVEARSVPGAVPPAALIDMAINQGRVQQAGSVLQNPLLRDARQQLPPPSETERVAAEEIVNKLAALSDVETWLVRLSQSIPTVCRVEYPEGTPRGTGFLVGPDLLMTNYHVIGKVDLKQYPSYQVVLRFDHRTFSDGNVIQVAKKYTLAADWLVDKSPFEELDYALLRLEGRPGDEALAAGVTRGWLHPEASPLVQWQPLFVIQHPDGQPLKVAFDIVTEATPKRVKYRTNTKGGSSGSPCFTDQWQLVALHHATENSPQPTYNEGIPFAAILAQPKVQAALGA